MQLLLLEDVDDLGRSGDIVNVKPGYARNFLIPRSKGLFADANARRRQAKLQEERAKRAIVDKQEAEALALQIEPLSLTTSVKVDHEGHMYGSVTALDIVRLLGEEGIALERRNIVLPHPIKQTGSHTIRIKLKEGVMTTCKLQILVEGVVEEVVVVEEAKETPPEEPQE